MRRHLFCSSLKRLALLSCKRTTKRRKPSLNHELNNTQHNASHALGLLTCDEMSNAFSSAHARVLLGTSVCDLSRSPKMMMSVEAQTHADERAKSRSGTIARGGVTHQSERAQNDSAGFIFRDRSNIFLSMMQGRERKDIFGCIYGYRRGCLVRGCRRGDGRSLL